MDAIPLPIQSILELFATDLADVRFADVDAKTLARVAADVRSAADVVAAAQLALDAARDALQERQDVLLQHAQRGLAYARVYAENDEALSARLESVALPKSPRAARRSAGSADVLVLSPDHETTTRTRGRPRKVANAEPMLEGVTLSAPGE